MNTPGNGQSASSELPTTAPAAAAPSPASTSLRAPESTDHIATRTEFAYYTHGNLQEMVKLADQKAATIIGGGGIIAAVLGSNLVDKFTPAAPALVVVAIISLGLLVGAVLCSVAVLWPRFPSERDVAPVVGAPRLLWATHIAAYHRRPADYARSLLAVLPSEVVLDVAYENLKITWLLERKWKWQRRATKLLPIAFAAWLVTIALAMMEVHHVERDGRTRAAAEELRRN